MKLIFLLILSINLNASFLIRTKHKKVHWNRNQIAQYVTTNIAIGIISGIVVKRNEKKVNSVTIFGPGTASVGVPK